MLKQEQQPVTKGEMARILTLLYQDHCNGWAINLAKLEGEYASFMPVEEKQELRNTNAKRMTLHREAYRT